MKLVKYDPEKFYCEYVRIKKITGTFIFISSRADGRVYNGDNVTKEVYKKRDVSKLRIDQSVSRQYFKNNTMREFRDVGAFACIAFYDGVVIAVETQSQISSNKNNQVWIATIDRVVGNIEAIIPSNRDVYIDGKEIFWLDEFNSNISQDGLTDALKDGQDKTKEDNYGEIKDKYPEIFISKDQSFSLKRVKYLSLSKVGITVDQDDANKITGNDKPNSDNAEATASSSEIVRTIGLKRNFSQKQVSELDFGISYINKNKNQEQAAIAFIKSSYVLSYNPYGNNGNKEYECYSSVLSIDDGSKKKDSKKEVSLLETLHSLYDPERDKHNPSFLNLNFTLHAGKVIGERFGYEETDLLNIHDIIADTGVISFLKINEASRGNYPIELSPFDGLAWLFKFVYKETKLDGMREINQLFTRIFNTGLVSKQKVESKFKEGMSESDIKMLRYIPKKTVVID